MYRWGASFSFHFSTLHHTSLHELLWLVQRGKAGGKGLETPRAAFNLRVCETMCKGAERMNIPSDYREGGDAYEIF